MINIEKSLLIPLVLLLTTTINAAGPVISPARDIGEFPLMQAVNSQRLPEAVSNGEDYLVVYMHGAGSLRAARVTSDGEVLDPFGIEIGNTFPSLLHEPFDVLWTGSRYLIAWHRPECDGFHGCLQLTAVMVDGEVEHLAQLPAAAGAQFAVRESSLLIAWREPDSLQASLVPLAGEPGEPVSLLEVDRYVSIEKVVATGSGYLVFAHARARADTPEQLLLIPVDSSGKAGEVSVLAEKGANFNLGFGSIATSGDTTAVLLGPGYRSRNLLILDPGGEELVRLDPFTASVPEDTLLLPDGNGFLMVSRQDESIVIRTLSPDGKTGPVWTLQPEIEQQRLSAIAAAPSSLLLLWEEHERGLSTLEPLNQWARTYDRALRPLGQVAPLMISAPAQRRSAVAAAGEIYLHVWDEYRDGVWQLYSQPMHADGEPTERPIEHGYGSFSVTSDGESFLLATGRRVWIEDRVRLFVELTQIGADGSVLERIEVADAIEPKIVFDGEHFVLLWWKKIEGRSPDVAMLTVLNDMLAPDTTVELDGFLDAAGFDGGVYILELIEGERRYFDYPPTRGLGVRVATTSENVTIGPQTVVVEPSLYPTREVLHEAIASNRSEALVYWQQVEKDGFESGYREASALVDSSGNIKSEVRGLLEKNRDTASGAMVWDGRGFVSANVSYLEGELLVQYFSPRGSFRERIEIPVDSYGGSAVSIASNGEGLVVVDYPAFVTNQQVGVGVERVFTRTIQMVTERLRPVRRVRGSME